MKKKEEKVVFDKCPYLDADKCSLDGKPVHCTDCEVLQKAFVKIINIFGQIVEVCKGSDG